MVSEDGLMRAFYDHILLLSGYKLASFLVDKLRLCGLLRPPLRLPDVNGVNVAQKKSLADLFEPREEWFRAGPDIHLHGAEACLLRNFIVL